MAQEQGGQREAHRLIGEQLQQARLAAGLTARQVSERTRIPIEVLQRVEDGRFDECGADVYARGHIRAYAQAVGLDSAPLLADYGAIRLPPLTRRDLRKPRVAAPTAKEALGTAPRGAQRAAAQRARSVLPTIVPGAVPSLVPMAGAQPQPEVPPLKHRRRDDFTDADAGSAAALVANPDGPPPVNERPAAFLAGARTPTRAGANWSLALIGALAAIGLVAAVQLWPSRSAGNQHSTTGATPGAQPTPTVAVKHSPVSAPAASPQSKSVDVRVVALKSPSWLGVTNASGRQLFWNMLPQGQAREFTDPSKLSVTLGDAAAVDLVVNGHNLGPQGSSGEVFHGSYSPSSSH